MVLRESPGDIGLAKAFRGSRLCRVRRSFMVINRSSLSPKYSSHAPTLVQFISSQRAEKYKVDPDKLGIAGASAGGHLSLMAMSASAKSKKDARGPRRAAIVKNRSGRLLLPHPPISSTTARKGEFALSDGILKGFRPPFGF